MKSLFSVAILAGALAVPVAALADDTPTPVVPVQVTSLVRGSLPAIETVYGTVGSASSSRQTIMAPLQAAVTNVYVKLGELVNQGAPLVRLQPSPASESAYTQADSALRVASDLVARTRALVKAHLATAQALLNAEKSEADARASLNALKMQGAAGPNIIRAPSNALVTKIETTPGAIVSEGAALVELAQPSGLVLHAGIVPSKARKIEVNDQVRLIPIGGGETLQGTVEFRGALVDAANGLVPIDISTPPGQTLMGEMFRAEITTGHIDGYVVPHSAILIDNAGNTYVVQEHDLTAKLVYVHVLGSDGSKDVVAGPLVMSDPVVLAGNYELSNGNKMTIAPKEAAQ